jgi:hypothetical protein
MLPGSLHSAAGAPECGAKENAGRSGRDDSARRRKTQEHRPFEAQGKQEWLCHKRGNRIGVWILGLAIIRG